MVNDTTERRLSRAETKLLEDNRKFHAYFRALGAFVHAFSEVEFAIQICLYRHTKVSNKVRRAVLSGVRVKEAIGYLRRLAEVREIRSKEWLKMKPLLDRLSILTDRRNNLLHFGADGIEMGEPFVSNNIRALTIDRLEEFPVSVEVLDSMSHDLRTIFFAISAHHAGRWHYSKRDRERAEWRSKGPWLYIPKPLRQNHSPQGGKSAKRPRQPRSSRG